MARGWLMTGQKAKGKEYIEAVWKNASQYLNYYLSLPNDRFLQAEHDCIRQIMIMQSICEAAGMVSPQLEQKYEKHPYGHPCLRRDSSDISRAASHNC